MFLSSLLTNHLVTPWRDRDPQPGNHCIKPRSEVGPCQDNTYRLLLSVSPAVSAALRGLVCRSSAGKREDLCVH